MAHVAELTCRSIRRGSTLPSLRASCRGVRSGLRLRAVIPDIRYVRTPDALHIAYQVVGAGPTDLVWPGAQFSNLEYCWQVRPMARFLHRLGAVSRLILFDPRGTGLSDRVPEEHIPTLESRMADALAVMDVVGSERAVFLGLDAWGPLAALFASTHPERTVALILYGTVACGLWRPDYPCAWREEQWERWIGELDRRWGEHDYFDEFNRWVSPSIAEDEDVRARWSPTSVSQPAPGRLW